MADLVDLSAYYSIQSAYFVRIDVPFYQVLRFSNFDFPYTIGGESYAELGKLLSVTGTQSELRVSEQEMSIAISGVPSGSVSEILDNPVKGSEVIVRRGFFDVNSGDLIPVTGNPAIKFQGVVSNINFSEELDQNALEGTFTITLVCVGMATLFKSKISGRRTNPLDEEKWFPTDSGFDRVPTLKNANFQFGAPRGTTGAGIS